MGLLITDPNVGGGGGGGGAPSAHAASHATAGTDPISPSSIGATQSNADATLKRLVLTPDSLTGSAATSALDISQTWNTTGNPAAIKVNITNTASGASALLMDLQVGGVSAFSVSKNGSVTATSAGSVFSRVDFTDRWVAGNCHATGGQLNVGSGDVIGWSSNNFWHGSLDVILKRAAAATLQLGEDHATTGTTQTVKSHNVTTGVGGGLRLAGGDGSTAKGAVTIDSRWRTQVPTMDPFASTVIALLDHGIMLPPANDLSDISTDSSSATVNISGLDLGIANSHRIEVQYSADNSTWLSAGIEYNTNTDIFFGIGGLGSSTLYYLRWRSIAPNNNDVFGAWQNTTFNTSE